MSSDTPESSSIHARGGSLGGGLSHTTAIRKVFLLVGVNKPSHRVSEGVPVGVPGALSWGSHPSSSHPSVHSTGKGQSWWGQCQELWHQPGSPGRASVAAGAPQVVLGSRGCATPNPGGAGPHVSPCFGRNRCDLFIGCLKGIRKRSVVRIWMTCFKSALEEHSSLN